jgi:hypothetical protein
MRRFNFGISCLAIASTFFAASSCSDDLEEEATPQSIPEATEKAYIAVTITTPDDATRADNDYMISTADERAINNAYFYFFADDGTLYSTQHLSGQIDGSVVKNGETVKNDNDTTANHIEWQGKTTVLVPDYDATTPPAYMVTVLNQPSSFPDISSFEDLQDALAQIPNDAPYASKLPLTYSMTNDNVKYFIMTTSSYHETGATQEVGVTYLSTKFFYGSEEEAKKETSNIVDVYVERLAAKVTLNIDSQLTPTIVGSDTLYQIKNAEDATNGTWTYNNGTEAQKKLYVKFGEWGINGQPTSSYYIKRIDASWTSDATGLGFTWNDPNKFRSYWAKSTNYADASYNYLKEYITAYGDIAEKTRATEEVTDATAKNKHLVYLSANQLKNALSAPGYCPENTNSAAALNGVENYQGAVTCVLFRGTLVDENGDPQDVIYYNKKFYTTAAFKQAALNVTGYNKLHNGSSTTDQLDADDLILIDNSYMNGHIDVALDTTTTAAATVWKDNDGNTIKHSDINAALSKVTETASAVYYNEGDMYYSIPIEHLRGGAPSKTDIITAKNETTEAKRNIIKEGEFGVVRNHIYSINIDAIQNPGHGIKDPDEPIVPPLEKDEKYYIGVKVNILSWKTVLQNVTL